MESLFPLVPITDTTIEVDYLHLPFLYFKLVLFAGFVILMWTLIDNKKEDNSWKPEHIAAILLGVTMPEKPIPLCDRIIFVYLIAIGFYTSCIFLDGITASKLITSNEETLETFTDLAHSNLILMIDPLIHHYIDDGLKDLQLLKRKMVPSEFVNTECISILVKHQNVSCVIMYSYARYLVKLLRDTLGQPVKKILRQKLFNTRRVMLLERSLPYKPRFDELINVFFVSGLRGKWENDASNTNFILELFNISKYDDQTFLDENDLGAVFRLGMVLFLTVLPGYLLSILFFVGKFCFGRCFKRLI